MRRGRSAVIGDDDWLLFGASDADAAACEWSSRVVLLVLFSS